MPEKFTVSQPLSHNFKVPYYVHNSPLISCSIPSLEPAESIHFTKPTTGTYKYVYIILIHLTYYGGQLPEHIGVD
jgi:hypothetical protein